MKERENGTNPGSTRKSECNSTNCNLGKDRFRDVPKSHSKPKKIFIVYKNERESYFAINGFPKKLTERFAA